MAALMVCDKQDLRDIVQRRALAGDEAAKRAMVWITVDEIGEKFAAQGTDYVFKGARVEEGVTELDFDFIPHLTVERIVLDFVVTTQGVEVQ